VIRTFELHAGGTAYTFPLPEWEYAVTYHLAMHHQPVLPRGYVIWDDEASNDFRTCQCRFLLDATDAQTLCGIANDVDKGRGSEVKLRLRSGCGWHPAGPDKGESGDFLARFLSVKPGGVLESPWQHFRVEVEFLLTSIPAYALPSEVSEGDLQIGTITGLRYPPDFPEPDTVYDVTTAVTRDGTGKPVDKLTDIYTTKLPMVCNESKAGALINHMVGTVRDNTVSIVAGANNFIFGRDNGGAGTHTCYWLNDMLTATHSRHDEWAFDLNFYQVSVA